MRYIIIPKGLTLTQVEEEVKRYGGKDIKVANRSLMVFAELDNAGLNRLKGIPGLAVKDIRKTKSNQVTLPPAPVITSEAMYATGLAIEWSKWREFREFFDPPLTGKGLTCAILGSGIRKTHRSLKGKVVLEKNFSSSPTCQDIFDHDTGVAYLVGGGQLTLGAECGLSPQAYLWNIKVLNDEGEATNEELILGMNFVHDMFCEAVYSELPIGDPMYVNAVNMSLGCEDTGDPEDPVRLAVEHLYQASPGKYPIFASVGNNGGYATLPAAAEHCWAVGACRMVPFELCEFSNRGSVMGLIKPEIVHYGENLIVASSHSDNAMVTKSGTSFASPLALGILCLTREAAERLGVLGDLIALTYEELEPTVQAMCTKPEGITLGKTEDGWGYGLPLGNLLAQQFQPAVGMGIETMIGQITPIVALAMVGMLVSGMTKTR